MSDYVVIGKLDGRFNLRLRPHALYVSAVLALLSLGLGLYSVHSGALGLSSHQVWQALLGEGSARVVLVVTQWRLPRVVMALVLGFALGVSGAIFQSLLRNPLGSPDVVGFNTGAYSGALLTIVLLQGDHFTIAAGALLGGLGTAGVVYGLAYRQGLHGFRLIIVGIALSAMLNAFNSWLMLTASLESAMTAAIWGAGTLNGITWDKGWPSALFCGLAIGCALALQARMRLLEMGDDSASALGVAAERTRVWLMGLGVILTAAATAATGPIAFIALAAPQVAQRLHAHAGLLAAGWVGAWLLLAADVAAQQLFAPRQLPVGVVTVSLGGVYLVWLLIQHARRGR